MSITVYTSSARNGISLCEQHHIDAEKFHITKGKQWVDGMHPNDLYVHINSSYDLAEHKSKNI